MKPSYPLDPVLAHDVKGALRTTLAHAAAYARVLQDVNDAAHKRDPSDVWPLSFEALVVATLGLRAVIRVTNRNGAFEAFVGE